MRRRLDGHQRRHDVAYPRARARSLGEGAPARRDGGARDGSLLRRGRAHPARRAEPGGHLRRQHPALPGGRPAARLAGGARAAQHAALRRPQQLRARLPDGRQAGDARDRDPARARGGGGARDPCARRPRALPRHARDRRPRPLRRRRRPEARPLSCARAARRARRRRALHPRDSQAQLAPRAPDRPRPPHPPERQGRRHLRPAHRSVGRHAPGVPHPSLPRRGRAHRLRRGAAGAARGSDAGARRGACPPDARVQLDAHG